MCRGMCAGMCAGVCAGMCEHGAGMCAGHVVVTVVAVPCGDMAGVEHVS